MAEIIDINNKISKKQNVDALDIIKEAMEIALQYFISNEEHHKAAVLTNTLHKWDEFFNKEGD
jgi:hypothetical protein